MKRMRYICVCVCVCFLSIAKVLFSSIRLHPLLRAPHFVCYYPRFTILSVFFLLVGP